ncbi:MAG: hypothetical protein ABIJ09_15340 [Pseudomonadota bacterium]
MVGGDGGRSGVDDTDCSSGQVCRGRVCIARPVVDASLVDALAADAAGGDGGVVVGGRIQVEPSDLYLEFGGLRLGMPVTLPVTESNVGISTLRVFQIRLRDNVSGEFSALPQGSINQDLAPGHELVVQVTHTPANGAADRAYLGVVSSDPDASHSRPCAPAQDPLGRAAAPRVLQRGRQVHVRRPPQAARLRDRPRPGSPRPRARRTSLRGPRHRSCARASSGRPRLRSLLTSRARASASMFSSASPEGSPGHLLARWAR